MKYILSLMLSLLSLQAYAYDARTYILMPTGTDVTEFRTGYSKVITPGSPDVYNQMEMVKHSHYFNFNGDLAAIYLAVPYYGLQARGLDLKKNGFADPTVLLAWGFYNMPALSPEAYQKFDKNGLTGACSIALTFPTGSYSSSTPLNTGGNNYTQKPECHLGWTQDKFMFEAVAGFTNFTKNSSYVGSNTLEQDKLYHFETHTSYNITPQLWASFDTFYLNGGKLKLNGNYLDTKQSALSLGFVVGYFFGGNQLIKLIYQNNASYTNTSTQLNGAALSYNYIW